MKKVLLICTLLVSTSILFAQNMNDSLYQAVVANDTTAIKSFIKSGGDVNFIKQQSWMKVNLLITAVNKENVDAVKVLLQHDADVNWKDGFNTTALMYAASKGNLKIVNLLLDYGADITHKDDQGNDAISTAKESGHIEIANLLEERLKSSK